MRLEGAAANHGTQRGKILGQRAEHAVPVLAVVNLQALEGGRAGCWVR